MSKKLSQTEVAKQWLEQFIGPDRVTASKLIDKITWISAVEFTKTLETEINMLSESVDGPIGLFIERELRNTRAGVQRFYKQKVKPRKAYGAALQPVESFRYNKREVGSEGIISTLATGMHRKRTSKYYIHPTIKQVKEERIENFVILTDTIGSGAQTRKFLESLWKVATIRSLSSFKRLKFHVIAYAATREGLEYIKAHPTKPDIKYSLTCPTIKSSFESEDLTLIESFCLKYYKKNSSYGPFGYGDGGVLLAYAHGIPNNSPTILHKKSKKGVLPLFESRAVGIEKYELDIGERKINFSDVFKRNGQLRLSTSDWLRNASENSKEFILVLSALNKSPRTIEAVSERTLVKQSNVKKHFELAYNCEWITSDKRLTDLGIKLLKKLKSDKKTATGVSWNIELLYYPKSLRVP